MFKDMKVGNILVYIRNGDKKINELKLVKINKKTYVVEDEKEQQVKINIPEDGTFGLFKGINEYYSGKIYKYGDQEVRHTQKINGMKEEAVNFIKDLKNEIATITVKDALQMKGILEEAGYIIGKMKGCKC